MWFNESIKEVIKKLNVDTFSGLTNEEVVKSQEEYGKNELEGKKKKSLFKLFLSQLNDALIYILIVAAIVSGAVGEISDTVIIAIVILINAVVGVVQESKAEKALEALKKMSTPKAIVKRNGEIIEIQSEEIVPGDIVILDAGRYIPCDLRLIETANLKVDESALTGESVPVDKDANLEIDNIKTPLGDRKNMAYTSTLVTYGRAVGIAVDTGMKTEIGKIAKMLGDEQEDITPLQKKLASLGKILGIGAVIICAVMFVVGVLQKRDILEMFLTAISLAVAAVPEGLAAIVTIVLALGVQRMIKENAIIRKLPAVETLGSVNIICSDKTGTLTQNKMTVLKYYANNKLDDIKNIDKNNKTDNLLIENIVLCNDSVSTKSSKSGDPTEIALIDVGINLNIYKDKLNEIHERKNEIPFDSDRKLMTTVNSYEDEYYVMTKGAVDNLIKKINWISLDGEILPITDKIKQDILESSESMSNTALRVLASAYKIIPSTHIEIDNLEDDLIFLGLVGMIDPPRLEVKDSIDLCKKSGIKTVMITGDHKSTAFAIAKELDIADNEDQAMFGYEIDALSDEEFSKITDKIRVYARVSPEHKVKIVKALKSKGNIVSMTGDGVNDAPSLKAADIGVAMGITGTDVAKGAADMILTDDNFSTIVSAIKEGRNIFSNIRKTILFLLSCNVGEIFAIFVAILLNWSSPLISIHILWVNLITDTFPALALGVDPGDESVMEDKPRDPKEGLFAQGGASLILVNGLLIGTLTLIAFVIGRKVYPNSLMHAQTMAFVVLSISQLFHAFNLRHRTKSIFKIGFFSNKYLVEALLFGIVLQFAIISIPILSTQFKVFSLTLRDWSFVGLLSICPIIFNEIWKIFKRRKL
ncbi:MAG: calcium-translocating P-type ATPase, PMCA-type [Clostridiaceae bacterium]